MKRRKVNPARHREVRRNMRDVTARRVAEAAAARAALMGQLVGLAGLAANEAPTAEQAALRILEALCKGAGFALGHLYLVAERDELHPARLWYPAADPAHQPFREQTAHHRLRPGEGLPGRVGWSGQVEWIADLAADPGFQRHAGAAASGLRSGVGVPIQVGRRVVGILELYATVPREPEADLGEALALAGTQLGRAFERQWSRHEHEHATGLEMANREIEAFSYSVSHDLRAPLRAVDGFSRILLERYGAHLPEEAQDYLHLIRTASDQMAQLIDDLLRLSRVSRAQLEVEPVDLGRLVRAKLRELQRTEPREDLEVAIADTCTALGDPQLLGLLVGNLLENAWKFTSKTPGARIEFGCEAFDHEVAYYVRDNGVGFDMTYVDQLFKPFSRLHRQEEFDGTGIGLATVYRIVSRHGGRAWAEGRPDQGATFYFTLPTAEVVAARRWA